MTRGTHTSEHEKLFSLFPSFSNSPPPRSSVLLFCNWSFHTNLSLVLWSVLCPVLGVDELRFNCLLINCPVPERVNIFYKSTPLVLFRNCDIFSASLPSIFPCNTSYKMLISCYFALHSGAVPVPSKTFLTPYRLVLSLSMQFSEVFDQMH